VGRVECIPGTLDNKEEEENHENGGGNRSNCHPLPPIWKKNFKREFSTLEQLLGQAKIKLNLQSHKLRSPFSTS